MSSPRRQLPCPDLPCGVGSGRTPPTHPQVAALHVTAKVVLVLASTVPAVLFFGALHASLTRGELQASCVKMYALLNRLPGERGSEGPRPRCLAIMALLLLSSLCRKTLRAALLWSTGGSCVVLLVGKWQTAWRGK
jgi:hypothetical protein